MPDGKPAGVRCVHLSEAYLCKLYHDPERPPVCAAFQASPDVCGSSRAEALALLFALELATL
jgi:hypothetical protein